MKKLSFKKGDTVEAIGESFGWGYVCPCDIGIISTVITDETEIKDYKVDFENQKGWNAREHDLRLIQTAPKKKNAPKSIKKEATVPKKEMEKEKMAKGIVEKVTDAGKKVATAQVAMAKTAATLEAARIFNNQLAKVASKKLPGMIRGYADTPVGRAIMANLILVGIETTMPGIGEQDVRKQVARAAVVESYGVLMQSFKLEDMLEELFEMPALKSLTGKIGLSEED